MKQTLIIHIGWHKTASTVIQLYFDKFRKNLRKNDICYPVIDNRSGFGGVKHSDLLVSIFDELKFGNLKVDVKKFDELVEQSVKEIVASKCSWAVLSEEGFSMENPGISKLMGRYREFFDEIKVVAYIRRQDYFFESMHAQVVKQKITRSPGRFKKFIELPMIRKRADYSKILDWWGDVFGVENILVAPFEPHVITPDPVTYFFKVASLPMNLLEEYPVEQVKAHSSPPREVTEFFRFMNARGQDFDEKILTEFLMKSGAQLTNTRYLSVDDRERILSEYENGNLSVARKYLKRDKGVLFEEAIKDYSNCQETWEGLIPRDVLDYAFPVINMMSFEISQLRIENQMMSSVKKMLSVCFRKIYNRLKAKGISKHKMN